MNGSGGRGLGRPDRDGEGVPGAEVVVEAAPPMIAKATSATKATVLVGFTVSPA